MKHSAHSLLVASLTGVVAASIVVAAGLTLADHDTACGGTSSMPSNSDSNKYYECNTTTGQWELKEMSTPATGNSGCSDATRPTNPPPGQWYECVNAIWELKGTPTSGVSGGGESADPATCTACITAGGTQLTCPTCPGYTGGGYGGAGGTWGEGGICPEFTMYRPCIESCMSRGGAMTCPMCGAECSSGSGGDGNAVCVADCVALTPGICQGSVAEGQRRVCDYKRDKNWSGTACEEFCNGGSGGGGGPAMNCRDSDAYYKCLGGRNVPTNSELSRSCEEKHCWYQGEDSGETGGEGEACRRNCEQKMRNCQRRASVAFSPLWCDQTLEECIAECPGGGGKKPPEGCRGNPPTSEQYGTWECIHENGRWDWRFKKTEEPKTFCEAFPTHEKCKKIEPKPRDQERLAKLESLEREIALLEGKITTIEDKIDVTDEKLQMLKANKAKKTEINKVKKAGKKLIKQHRKLEQKLSRLNQKYDLLSQ